MVVYPVSSGGISFHALGDTLLTILEHLVTSDNKSQVRCAMPEQCYLLDSRVIMLPCSHHHATVFCRCFPAGLSCHSSIVQCHIWPWIWLSKITASAGLSISLTQRPQQHVKGCWSLHRLRQASPCWSQSTWILEDIPVHFKFSSLMTRLILQPRVHSDSFKKIEANWLWADKI